MFNEIKPETLKTIKALTKILNADTEAENFNAETKNFHAITKEINTETENFHALIEKMKLEIENLKTITKEMKLEFKTKNSPLPTEIYVMPAYGHDWDEIKIFLSKDDAIQASVKHPTKKIAIFKQNPVKPSSSGFMITTETL